MKGAMPAAMLTTLDHLQAAHGVAKADPFAPPGFRGWKLAAPRWRRHGKRPLGISSALSKRCCAGRKHTAPVEQWARRHGHHELFFERGNRPLPPSCRCGHANIQILGSL